MTFTGYFLHLQTIVKISVNNSIHAIQMVASYIATLSTYIIPVVKLCKMWKNGRGKLAIYVAS